jgi:TP901 family phage tail tape measure protein
VSVVANVAINVDSSGAVSKLRQVNDAGSKLEQTFKGVDGKLRDANGRFIKLGDAAQASTGKINFLSRAISNLGTSLAVADAARRYFKGFNEAEKAAAAVRTLGVDSKALEGNLLGLSQELGGLFSQTQLLTAAYDVASSGFANAADNTKVLEAAAKGATGGLSDIGTVGNAVTSVLNAYGKSADEAASLVDGFIQTQNDGKIILNEYAGFIGRLAPTAKAAGVGINEMNAAIAAITAQGVPVEATFTGLNQALVSILKPSQEAEELAKSLGIQFNEAGLRAKGFGGLLEEVKTKTGGGTTQLVKLFGSVDALKAILPLVNDDLVKYNQNVVKQANASGVAEKATEELGGTVSSEITKMINQIGNLVRSLDTVLGPALGGIVRLINFVIAEATKGIQVLGQLFSMSPGKKIAFEAVRSGNLGAAARVLPGIDETIGEKRRKQLQQQAGAGTGFLGMGMDQSKFIKLLQQQPEFKSPVAATAAATPTVPTIPTMPVAGGGGGRAAGGGGASKAADEAKRAAEAAAQEAARVKDVIRNRLAEGQIIAVKTQQQDRIAAAEAAGDKMLVARLQSQERELEIQYRYAQELAKEVNLDAQKAIIYEGQNALTANQLDLQRELDALQSQSDQDRLTSLQKAVEKQYELNTAVQNQLQLADGVANTLGQGLGSAFDALISGAQGWEDSLKQIASGVLVDIANQLIRIFVIEQAINAIKSFLTPFSASTPLGAGGGQVGKFGTLGPNFGIPQRAKGGPVSSGQTYMVGERGPELFVPGRSGTIVANDKMGGGSTNVVVNVDAKGSSVEGNDQGANQLGRVISAAVQSELIKQQRPGGILAR